MCSLRPTVKSRFKKRKYDHHHNSSYTCSYGSKCLLAAKTTSSWMFRKRIKKRGCFKIMWNATGVSANVVLRFLDTHSMRRKRTSFRLYYAFKCMHKIAEKKEVWRSVFLTIKHYILNADSTIKSLLRSYFCRLGVLKFWIRNTLLFLKCEDIHNALSVCV